MYFDRQGNLIACADEKNELWSIAPDGKVTVLLEEYQGKAAERPERRLGAAGRRALLHRPVLQAALVDAPRDAAGRPARLLPVRRPPEARARDRGSQASPTASSARPTARRCTWRTSARARPTATTSGRTAPSRDKTLVCEQGSDGMTLDSEGNLYLTGEWRAWCSTRRASRSSRSRSRERWTANVSFGGKDRQTLFITASTGLYAIRMRVQGANAAK